MPPAAQKQALLIGNDRYQDLPDLKVPAADVAGLARVLTDPAIGGFAPALVKNLANPDYAVAHKAIGRLFANRQRDDLVLLYFSGHGELDHRTGRLYLALPDSERDCLDGTALAAPFITDVMDRSPAGRQILILDCCYAGAIGRKGAAVTAATFGADPASAPAAQEGYGRVILTSSTAGQSSWEGNRVIAGVERSLFTHFLIQGLETGEAAAGAPTVSVEQLYQYVHAQVVDATKGGARRMTPERFGQVRGELILARNPQARAPATDPKDLLGAPPVAGGRRAGWLVPVVLGAAGVAAAVVLVSGMVSKPVQPVVIDSVSATAAPLSTFADPLKDGSAGPTMVRIPAGTFQMGSPDSEPEHGSDEQQHSVTIKPFAIGKYEVSFAEYDRFAKETGRTPPDDNGWGRGDRPVINVSWDDATAYAAWLAEQTGRPYRLPTEAEWEYAARAGTDSPFWTGACIHTDQANYDGTLDYNGCGAKTGVYREQTLPVDSLAANPWGLHHVAGNVWEWTCSARADPYDGNEMKCISNNDANSRPTRVIRGGAWSDRPAGLRSAFRLWTGQSIRVVNLGCRLAQDL